MTSTAARFTQNLTRLIGDHNTARLGIAVSGGPDSLALLLLAHDAAPGRIAAATVDHGLRPAAADEAAMVAAVAADLGIPHATLRPDAPITGSLQAGARRTRYNLLETWRIGAGLDWLLTAHHADDQAETMLMRLNRGAGVGGLAGIRAVNGRIVRPLLDWRRLELAAIVEAAGLVAIDDPSNRDARFDRARVRTALQHSGWIDPRAFAASAAHLADAHDALDWTVRRLAGERLTGDGTSLSLDPADLPAELRRRLLAYTIDRLDPGRNPPGPDIDRLLETLAAGGKASIGALVATGGPVWRLAPAPPRRTK